ncbi:MAG TPA: alpha/beta fold hydrolase BchO [Gemmatimonadaceae bacterium]|nr:alpha/beta fold hydrolase BchO [Gemmatimonadaceae bacterium]
MRDTPSWVALGDVWPNRQASHFVEAGAQRWHVQLFGSGPPLLLVHGTGSATHSWRDLAPRLARRFTVIAPDLPGHGFTTAPRTDLLSLDGLASELGTLLDALGAQPAIGVAHGAGMAVLLRHVLERPGAFRTLVGINAALTPPRRHLWTLLAPAANVSSRSSFVDGLGSRLAQGSLEESLLRSMGSAMPDAQAALYTAFLRSRRHMGAVTTMFANWDAGRLQRDLAQLELPVTLAVALNDPWVPARIADRLAGRFRNVRIVEIGDCGHLAHEEKPGLVETIVVESAQREGVLARSSAGAQRPADLRP